MGRTTARLRQRVEAELRRDLALEKFQEERPQLWLQFLRLRKLVDVQDSLEQKIFPSGSCFLHASTVTTQSYCVKRVTGIDLDSCLASVEIYGDEEMQEGIVLLPLESIEWFGFPATAVSTGMHISGFTAVPAHEPAGAPAGQALDEKKPT